MSKMSINTSRVPGPEGAKIIFEPEDGFWGGRIYRAVDHEGHRWEIGQRGRDFASDAWQLPPGVTREASK